MNRKVRSILALGILLGGLWLSPLGLHSAAGARSGPDVLARVGFSQETYNVTVGDDFPVVVIVVDAEWLAGWEAILAYDPDVVRFNTLSAGAFLASGGRGAALLGPTGDPASGAVALGGYSWDPTGGIPDGVSGGGEIAHVGLHAAAVGQSVLDLTDPVLASVQGASVAPQEVEAHTAQVNVYAAPVAPAAAVVGEGNDVVIAWQRGAAEESYKVWRHSSPYFEPNEGDSAIVAEYGPAVQDNCTLVGETVSCSDPNALAAPGQFFYIVQSLNPAGAGATSRCMGAFVFPIQPGN